MKVGVDEAGDGEKPGAVDYRLAVISVMRADYAISDDGDVGALKTAADHIEKTDILDDQIGRPVAGAGSDTAREEFGLSHMVSFPAKYDKFCFATGGADTR